MSTTTTNHVSQPVEMDNCFRAKLTVDEIQVGRLVVIKAYGSYRSARVTAIKGSTITASFVTESGLRDAERTHKILAERVAKGAEWYIENITGSHRSDADRMAEFEATAAHVAAPAVERANVTNKKTRDFWFY